MVSAGSLYTECGAEDRELGNRVRLQQPGERRHSAARELSPDRQQERALSDREDGRLEDAVGRRSAAGRRAATRTRRCEGSVTPRTVVALAGRRIDAPDADTARFPLSRVQAVRDRIREFLVDHAATAIVSSAACGADLIALDVAGALGLRRRVVLPLPRAEFRQASVTDRPGDWGVLFDRIMDEVSAAGDLVGLPGVGKRDAAFAATNAAILEEALRVSRQDPEETRVVALAVWDGRPRGEDDLTEQFTRAAREGGVPVAEVLTL
jgi:hypothetical protein